MAQLQNAVKIHGENVGRSLRKQYVSASVPTWEETGRTFHIQYRPKRFTPEHARAAKFTPRDRKYTNRKFREFGHRNPLEKTGEVKRLTRTAKITARAGTGQLGNKGGVNISYPGARKLNFKNQFSSINMVDEFTRVPDQEARLLGLYWETRFTIRFGQKG